MRNSDARPLRLELASSTEALPGNRVEERQGPRYCINPINDPPDVSFASQETIDLYLFSEILLIRRSNLTKLSRSHCYDCYLNRKIRQKITTIMNLFTHEIYSFFGKDYKNFKRVGFKYHDFLMHKWEQRN